MRGEHHRPGRVTGQVERTRIQHGGHALRERRAHPLHEQRVIGVDAGAEQPGLHPAFGGHRLGAAGQHASRAPPR